MPLITDINQMILMKMEFCRFTLTSFVWQELGILTLNIDNSSGTGTEQYPKARFLQDIWYILEISMAIIITSVTAKIRSVMTASIRLGSIITPYINARSELEEGRKILLLAIVIMYFY